MMNADGSDQRPLTPLPEPKTYQCTPRFSPDGRKVAYEVVSLDKADDWREIWLVDLTTERAARLSSPHGSDTDPAFLSDSQTILFSGRSDGKLYTMDLQGGNRRLYLEMPGHQLDCPTQLAAGTEAPRVAGPQEPGVNENDLEALKKYLRDN